MPLADNVDFLDQIVPNRVFLAKNKKIEYHHWILHIRISLSIKFHLELTISIFWTRFAQKSLFFITKRKSDYHHWILHVPISQGTKFQLKLIILTLWTKFAQKRCFQSKTEKVDITIEFYIFELLKVQNLSLNW